LAANDITRSLERIALYLERVRDNLERGDRSQALADLAELGEISRRLWNRLERREQKPR
jgi:hypothetical protein